MSHCSYLLVNIVLIGAGKTGERRKTEAAAAASDA